MSTFEGGETIGRYKILRPLGMGAMGRVYLAEDPRIERLLAIKTVRVEGEGMEVEERKRRLLREAKAAGRLIHRHVVTLFDAGEEGDELFLAFEYVQGSDLARRLASGPPLTLGEALRIARQAAEGLDFAHRQGVIHRDVKPSNVLLDEEGRVKVSDFGIAKLAGQSTELTMTGSVVGSPHYLSPEQIRGEELDGRSDLFSLGVLLYELLSRRRPFEGETLTTLLYQILHTDPPPLAAVATGHGARLDALVRRLMAKDPAARFATAGEVAAEITALEASLPPQVLASPAVAGAPPEGTEVTRQTPPPLPPPSPPAGAAGPAAVAAPVAASRKGLWLGLAALAAAVLVGVGAAAYFLTPRVLEALRGGGEELVAVEPAPEGEAAPVAGMVGEGDEPERPPVGDRTSVEGTAPGTRAQTLEAPPRGAVEEVEETPRQPPGGQEPAEPPSRRPEPAGEPARGGPKPSADPVSPGTSRSQPATSSTPPAPPVATPGSTPAPAPVPPAPEPRQPDASPPVSQPEPEPQVDRRLETGMTVRFQVQPPDAFVLVDGTVLGRASEVSAAGGYTLPSPGEHLVVVRRPGRRDARLLLAARPGGGTTVVPVRLEYLPAVELALEDLPRYRVREAVAFKVEPKQAQVLVDGVLRGQASDFGGFGRGWLRLERGLYRISLVAPGRRRVDLALEVGSGASEEREKIELVLPPEEEP